MAQGELESSPQDCGKPSTATPRAIFFPPLQAQRRGFILSTLRAHDCHSVGEVGCGDGGLLRALCELKAHSR